MRRGSRVRFRCFVATTALEPGMPPQYGVHVLAAFTAASGIPVAVLLDAIRLALGGVVLIWFTWAASRVGMQALRNQLSVQRAGGYILRAAVLTTLVLFALTA